MVDVSARARRRAALARVGEFVPASTEDRFGTAEVFPQPSCPPEPEQTVGRARRMRMLGLADIEELAERPPLDDRTGPIARIPAITAPEVEDPTGPIPVVAPVAVPVPDDLTAPIAVVRAVPPQRTRSVAVRATVLAVLIALVGGGASALAMDKTVVLSVDGQERTIHTFAGDVAGALAAAGMTPAPQDRVAPALPTELADGDYITFDRARPLTLMEGGSERQIWTTAASVQDALAGLGMEAAPIQMSTSPDAVIPLAGLSLELSVPRNITLADGPAAQAPLTTTAGTVAGLLAEQGITLGPDDVAVPSPDTALADGIAVQIVRNGEGEVIETRQIAPPEQIIEDPETPRGEREVVDPGRPGEQSAVVRVYVQNGQEVRREQVRAGSSTPPSPRVVKVGTGDEPEPEPEEE
ncbi:MAG: DUF348 domain-containing protein, partial [Pseudonocardia sp.]|nr:DUF348 domain-containing protein [Pseudonocardia sp.]